MREFLIAFGLSTALYLAAVAVGAVVLWLIKPRAWREQARAARRYREGRR